MDTSTPRVTNGCCTTKTCGPRKSTARTFRPFGFGTSFPLGSSILDDFLRIADPSLTTEYREAPRRTEASRSSMASKAFALNVVENESSYILEALLAGVKKDLVEISVEDGKLTLSINTPEEAAAKEYAFQEWAPVSGTRTFALPKDANPEAVKATMAEGVLRLEISKLEEKQPKKVEIH